MADADPGVASTRRMLSGTAALVELPLLQRRLDTAAGLNTGGYISGYRGSPLGGYDQELTLAKERLEAENIRFQPGLNEDLAATAIWGTQQVGLWPGATVDGVFGIWYGKGPGVDRSLDALKHGNAAGSAAKGGVLLVAGDDHGCVSSTLPHQSEQVFAAAMIPVLTPSSVAEIIDYGLIGIALSRYSGCWVAMTGASEVIETSAMVDLDKLPEIVLPGPVENLHLRWPDPPPDQEKRLHGPKMDAVRAFAAANRIDRIAVERADARLVIVTTGKAYGDVRGALDMLGDVPVRVFKVGMSWPLQPAVIEAIAGAEEVLVVEEKRGFVEDQLVGLLYSRADRPRVLGKAGGLLPTSGELGPGMVARVIADRLEAITGERPAGAPPVAAPVAADGAVPVRAPFFCAGCPHNSSTVLPEGSRAMGGIGCHGMATWMPDRNTAFMTHMGAEGVPWIGQAPFTTEPHIFQNMGDGTYNHSGLLAIRAAIAAGVSITYKILYNDAVAMTGGQPHDGAVSVEGIAAQMLAEGAREVVVVSETPERFAAGAIPAGVAVHDRAELDMVQRRLREQKGVSVIVYDQTCAAELRRRRRTDETLRRTKHIVINPEVCEACGDCSAVSNCIAIQPLETPLGRKRRVDPASCNQDYSCLEGYCPSFVSIETSATPGTTTERTEPREPPRDLPVPLLPDRADIVIAGIGGTGVVTIGAILGAAAEIEGRECAILDITGLSQKNGAVLSQVRLRPAGDEIHGARVPEGNASLLIACDLVAAAAPGALSRCGAGTRASGNGDVTPTAAFIRDGAVDLGKVAAAKRIGAVCESAPELIDATGLAERFVGGAIGSNIMLLGHAWQRGLVPIGLEAIEAAIGRVAKGPANLAAFRWGRALADDPSLAEVEGSTAGPGTLEALIEDRARRLTDYQDAAFADLYRGRVERVAAAERERVRGSDVLARATADALYRMMAVKDEYEVARLHLSDEFARDLRARFGEKAKLSYHLAAPILGERKRRFGSWIRPFFYVLAAMRGLRGGPFDPFGRTAERRMERALERRFADQLDAICPTLSPASHADALARVEATRLIRGFGHIKRRNIERYEAELGRLDRAGNATVSPISDTEIALDKKVQKITVM